MGKASISIDITSAFNSDGVNKAVGAVSRLGNQLSRMEKLTAASANSTTRALAQQGIAAERAAAGIVRHGKAVADFGDRLTRAVTLPMVAVGAYSGKMAVDFDTAMANLQKTSDMSRGRIEQFAQAALESSKVQPVSAEAILNIEALGSQLGVADGSLQAFAKTVSGLDIATNMNADTAATQMARFANIVGMAEGDYERFGSTIVDIGNNMATTESEVVSMAMRFASAGKQAGLSEAQILGMSGAMSSLGIKAEMGGSALSQIFVEIGKAVASGGAELEAFSSAAGMSAEQFAAAWGENAAGAFNALVEGIGRASQSGKDMNVVMAELGFTQIRQSDVMRRLAGSTSAVTGQQGLLANALGLAESAWKSNTALQDEVDTRNESMASRLQVLKNRIDAVAITVGRPLVDAVIAATDALSPAIEAVGSAAQAFADMDEGAQRNALAIAGMAAAAGPALSTVGRIEQGVGGLVGAFARATERTAVYKDALATVDGNQMRTYSSAKTLASYIGTSGNVAARAAGGVDNYVHAWDRMNVAAGTVRKSSKALARVQEELSSAGLSGVKATDAYVIGLKRQEAGLQGAIGKAKDAFAANASLVSGWSGSTKEAMKAADGIDELSDALSSVESTYSGTAAAASRAAQTMRGPVVNGLSAAAQGAAGFMKAAAPMLAISAIVAVVGAGIAHMAEESRKAEEHERLMADATRSASTIMEQAGAAASNMGDRIGDVSAKASEVAESMAELNAKASELVTDAFSKGSELEQYTACIEQLANRSGLTATEQERLKIAVKGYNDITGAAIKVVDAANGKIADQAGTLYENTEELRRNTEEWKRNAKAKAYQQLATEYIREQVKAERELSLAKDKAAQAQETLNEKSQRLQEMLAQGLDGTGEYGKLAAEVWKAQNAFNDADRAVRDLSGAYDTASQSAQYFTNQAALESATFAQSVKDNISGLPLEFQAFAIDIATHLQATGREVGTFEQNLASMGLNAQTVTSMSAQNFAALYTACSGNLEQMKWCIENYNAVPIIDKDGSVNVNDASLVDAQGNVWTWNGTGFTSKTADALVRDQQLRDAQGRVYTWNGTQLVSKDANTKVDSDQVDKANKREDERNKKELKNKKAESKVDSSSTQTDIDRTSRREKNPPKNQSASTTINRYENVNKTVTTSYVTRGEHAAGGIFHAAGGIMKHASGMIVSRATDVTRHIAGEAGAEAIIPLTNRRYTRPFARTVAEETVAAMGSPGGGNTYVVNINGARVDGGSGRAMEAIRVLFEEFNLTNEMGVC